MLAAGYQRVARFCKIEPNPSWQIIQRGSRMVHEEDTNCLVAIGGGSVLDAAKVIALKSGVNHLVTIPTTAGTGSELNEWGVITNTKARIKESVQATMPNAAILDPELTLSAPPTITLLTGVDAFCHALECYVGTTANTVTDCLALQAMELIVRWLRPAVENGSELEARSGMLEASMLAGATMLGAGLGLMHGIGNIAGGLAHAAHGLVLTRLLQPVMEFNRPAIEPSKLHQVEPFLEKLVPLVEKKLAELDVPPVRLAENDLSLLAHHAALNVNSKTNPRPFHEADLVQLARTSFQIIPSSESRE